MTPTRGPARTVTARVPAKVNLQLSVGPLRADGYHDLVTVFHAVSLFDEVTVAQADRTSVAVTGEGGPAVPLGPANLAVRAAAALARATGRRGQGAAGVRIEIRKRIPVAAGLAGGSADAAAALVACNELWGPGCSVGRAQPRSAARIGSDVPFALIGGTAVGLGRGERLTTALASGSYHWVLAFGASGLSTPDVYAACDRLRADRTRPRSRRRGPGARAEHRADGGAALRRPGRGRPAAQQRPPAGRAVAAAAAAPRARGGPGARRARRDRVRLGADLRVPGRRCRGAPATWRSRSPAPACAAPSPQVAGPVPGACVVESGALA